VIPGSSCGPAPAWPRSPAWPGPGRPEPAPPGRTPGTQNARIWTARFKISPEPTAEHKAARRAFSPISHITQRDGGIGMRRAAAPSCAPATETAQDCSTATYQGRPSWMIPGWRPSPVPGSPEVCMHPADIPAIREPIHEPRRYPGVSGRGSRSSPAP
jgi:hypothetical protein